MFDDLSTAKIGLLTVFSSTNGFLTMLFVLKWIFELCVSTVSRNLQVLHFVCSVIKEIISLPCVRTCSPQHQPAACHACQCACKKVCKTMKNVHMLLLSSGMAHSGFEV
jgi:hypothetical protein